MKNNKRIKELEALRISLSDVACVCEEVAEVTEYVRNAEKMCDFESCRKLEDVLYHLQQLPMDIDASIAEIEETVRGLLNEG